MSGPPQRAGLSSQAGLTLVELMISMVITSIAVAAALTMGFSMSNGHKTSQRAIAVARQASGALNFIAAAVRNASPGVSTGNVTDLVGCTTGGAISVVNSSSGPDELTVIYGSGGILTSLAAPFDQTASAMTVTDVTGFHDGDLVVVTNFSTGHLLRVASVNTATSELTLAGASSGLCGGAVFNYPMQALVIRSKIANFRIVDGGGTGTPVLYMNPDPDDPTAEQPIAEGIEDLQIAVAVDTDANGTLLETPSALDEWFYNFPGDADPPAVTTTAWRAVRLSLTARSVNERSAVADSLRPSAEDRTGATAPDSFRRRSISTTIEIRNLPGSP